MTSPTHKIFLDCETTGLDPSRHTIWEIGFAIDDEDIQAAVVTHSLVGVDADALEVGNYWARMMEPFSAFEGSIWEDELKNRLTAYGDDICLVGANPRFDAEFLRVRWGFEPWHYRLLDVESYAIGIVGPLLDSTMPQGLATIATVLRDLGWTIPEPDHSAGGDVATLRAVYRALQGKGEPS